MRVALLRHLACPACHGDLSVAAGAAEVLESGELRCEACGERYPVRGGIPRFVPDEGYAASFGWQWNRFARTQLDEEWGIRASGERFFRETRWPHDLAGQVILEAGCGAGRFTGHAASTGAVVLACDASRAVEAAHANHRGLGNALFFQADVRRLPIRPGTVDRVFCFGVLQHTPDPEATFRALLAPLREGGEVVFDVYRLWWRSFLAGKYYLRPITKRLPLGVLWGLVRLQVAVLWPLLIPFHWLLGRRAWNVAALFGMADYRGVHDLPAERLRELSLLDTLDMLSPAHDHPRTLGAVRRWLREAGLEGAEASPGYNGIEGRGRKPG